MVKVSVVLAEHLESNVLLSEPTRGALWLYLPTNSVRRVDRRAWWETSARPRSNRLFPQASIDYFASIRGFQLHNIFDSAAFIVW